jgi:D-glycero-alpha-D-manno-heptose 1-phosphate guanylyltransferase
MFEAVVLMGGFGTRLKSVSGDTPKPMVPVAGQPFVYHLLKKLEKAGCRRIILSLHYQADFIEKKISEDSPVKCQIIFVTEDRPLGTGGGIKLAAKFVTSEDFLVINGDTYCEIDYLDFYKKSKGNSLVISGVQVQDASRYGSLQYDAEYNLTSMTEKGCSGQAVINSGTYFLATTTLAKVDQFEFSFEEFLITGLYRNIKVYIFEGDFIDIGIPEDYLIACKKLL